MRKLIVITGPSKGAIYPLAGPIISLGRGADNAIELPSIEISRHHAELSFDGTTLKVRDLNSINGTFVNNSRVIESLLFPGDRLRLGRVDLLYDVSETTSAAEIAPQNPDLSAEFATARQTIAELSQQLTSVRSDSDLTTTKLVAQSAELTRQNQGLCVQVAALAQQKQDLAAQLLAAQTQLAASRDQTTAVIAKLSGAEQRMSETEQRNQAELSRVNAALAQAKQQAVAAAAKTSEEHAALTAQFHNVQKQLKAESAQQTAQFEATLADAQNTSRALRSELDQARTAAVERDELARANRELTDQLAARNAELVRVAAASAALRADLERSGELAVQLATEKQNHQHAAVERQRLLARLADNGAQMAALQTELAETRAQLEIADAASLRVAELTERNRELETEHAAMRQASAAAEQAARERAAAETQRAHGELARVRTELDLLSQRVAAAEVVAAQHEQLAAQLREAQTDVVAAQQAAAVDASARRDSETQLAQVRAEWHRRESELTVLRVAAAATPPSLRIGSGPALADGFRPPERRRRQFA